MSETRLLKTTSQIFKIDPATKSSWLTISKGWCPLHVYHDTEKKFSRIVAMEGDNTVLNSMLENGTVLTRTSPKFGQWREARTKTVYGLGFKTEDDFEKFATAFDQAIQTCTDNISRNPRHSISSVRSVSKESTREEAPKIMPKPTSDGSANGQSDAANQLATLKYENDRLKTALQASRSNAEKWEEELRTLRNTNARLTTAMQDSAKNVEQWKVQLKAWKQESDKLKKQLEAEREKLAALADVDTTALESVKADLVKSREETASFKDKLADTEAELSKVKAANTMLEETIASLRQETEEAKAKADYKEKYEVLQQELVAWKASFAERVAEMGDFFSAFDGLMAS
eukprot:TRINITY_DN10125_c0_g1_i1.p1 TRINITY_DN10125_c0_g1~~TRINITY_DN10125_c0_g1_i1.p1  ORF type:complete len:345 (+),score=65.99 TRINITY_DN10125_c0_g1_i1:1474-2508(+)